MSPIASPQRLLFLDWLRIGAFALLVLYHVGMYYVRWPWHVKSPQASAVLQPWMLLSSPWRLSLLFLVSGAATSFMLKRDGASARLLGSRFQRLALPLVFGMVALVPPQAYFEAVQQYGYGGSGIEFLALYFSGYHGFCRPRGECLILPTWNHLWFLPYLFGYTLVLWVVVRLWPSAVQRIAVGQARLLRGAAWLCLPVAVLAALRLTMIEHFAPTHALVDDWYLHASYFAVFLLGAAWARDPTSWERCLRLRWVAAGLALLGWAAILAATGIDGQPPRGGWAAVARTGFATTQWAGVVAAVGFARRHLNRDHRWRQTLAEAVFPVYVVHQTLIIGLAMTLLPLRWSAAVEAPVLVVLAFVGSFGVYLLVRRVPVLRPLFGLNGGVKARTNPAFVAAQEPP